VLADSAFKRIGDNWDKDAWRAEKWFQWEQRLGRAVNAHGRMIWANSNFWFGSEKMASPKMPGWPTQPPWPTV